MTSSVWQATAPIWPMTVPVWQMTVGTRPTNDGARLTNDCTSLYPSGKWQCPSGPWQYYIPNSDMGNGILNHTNFRLWLTRRKMTWRKRQNRWSKMFILCTHFQRKCCSNNIVSQHQSLGAGRKYSHWTHVGTCCRKIVTSWLQLFGNMYIHCTNT